MSEATPGEHLPPTLEVLELFRLRGDSQYGSEAVTQAEHALQAACFAEAAGSGSALIAAALLHDVGHLLHDLPDDAPEQGIDDRHELLAGHWLRTRFPSSVWEPVRLHVAAKRYLCAADDGYLSRLSPASVLSLGLQGGPMDTQERLQFEQSPAFEAAVKLRRWDDAAKIPGFVTPTVEHFARYLDSAVEGSVPGAKSKPQPLCEKT